MFKELVRYERDGLREVSIFGAVCIWSHERILASIGDDPLLYGRSLTKPYQIKPIARDLRELSTKARALSLASHNAESFHLEALKEISSDSIFSHVKLPDSLPLMLLGRTGLRPSRENHPCSGKHSAILRASMKHGWPTENYQSQAHPYHVAYLQSLRLVLGSHWEAKQTAVDGCGLPAPSFRLSELAHLYEALSARRDDDWIWSAMTENPEMVGGSERLDTGLMKANPGRLIAKEGADGLLGLAFENGGAHVGIAIKVAHGHDPRALGFIARDLLLKFGLSPTHVEAPHGQTAEVAAELKSLHAEGLSTQT